MNFMNGNVKNAVKTLFYDVVVVQFEQISNIPKLILLSFEDLMKMVPLAGQRVGILFGL